MPESTERIWRNTAGRYVPEGHPEAAVLAYPVGSIVTDDVLEQVKAASKPADKSATVHEDKGVADAEVDDRSLDDLRDEYEHLTGEKPDGRWGYGRLVAEIDTA